MNPNEEESQLGQDAGGDEGLDNQDQEQLYDDDGNPIDPDIEYDDDGNPIPPETHTEEPTQPTQPTRTPPAFSTAGMTAEQKAELNDLFLTDPTAAFERFWEIKQQEENQRGRVTRYHADTIEQTAPRLMQKYGDHIREGISAVTRQTPNSDDALNVGLANAFLNALRANKSDIQKTVAEFAATLEEEPAQRPAPKAKPAPLPATQRTPRPAVATTGRGTAPAAQATRGTSARVATLMNIFGLSRADAERAASAETR